MVIINVSIEVVLNDGPIILQNTTVSIALQFQYNSSVRLRRIA